MINGVSLFSNVGIAEFYLKNLGINIVVANELIQKRCNLYNFFHKETEIICGDITDENIFNSVLSKSIKYNCDFLIATPPCQGMSVAGKMQENDPRNKLIIKVVEFLKKLKPSIALIENVPTFFSTYIFEKGKKVLISDYLKQELGDTYNLNMDIINAADYGTAQTRKRAITLLSKKGLPKWKFPAKQKQITVREAIGYLPSLESGEKSDIKYHYAKKHKDSHILCMKHTPTGKTAFENEIYFPKKDNGERIKGFSTTYKRIEWDKPAPTITMSNGAISSQNNVHPGRKLKDGTYSDARVLSLKEIFILTGLPDDIEFPDWASDNFIRQVIGEGIPPKMIFNIIKNYDLVQIKNDNKSEFKKYSYSLQRCLFNNNLKIC